MDLLVARLKLVTEVLIPLCDPNANTPCAEQARLVFNFLWSSGFRTRRVTTLLDFVLADGSALVTSV